MTNFEQLKPVYIMLYTVIFLDVLENVQIYWTNEHFGNKWHHILVQHLSNNPLTTPLPHTQQHNNNQHSPTTTTSNTPMLQTTDRSSGQLIRHTLRKVHAAAFLKIF